MGSGTEFHRSWYEKNRTFILKKYKHLFFDLDGTLWDLQSNTRTALVKLFEIYASETAGVNFEQFYKAYHHHNDRVWALYREGKIEKEILRTIRFHRAFEEMGMTPSEHFIESFSEEFLNISPRQPKTLEGAHELLQHCSGRYTMHIITNGFIEVQGHKMEAAALTPYFTEIINSEHCGVRKPHPGIFEYALKKAGATVEESLMIGDDWDADILGARDFGMDQVYLTTTEDMMNKINADSGHAPRRHNYKATYTISSLRELQAIL